MKFRKLRIAFSATCLIACVLLIVFWVRSNFWVEQVFVPVNQATYVSLGSMPNAFIAGLTDKSPTGTWAVLNMPTIDWLAALYDEAGTSHNGSMTFSISADGVMMPYWFGVLLSAAFGTAPWLRWRFSLRTLFIAMTLIALLLGLVAYASR